MKLNFWQILGILLLIVGVVLVFRNRIAPTDTAPPQNTTTTNSTIAPAPTTAP